ncbi:hypothetical protein GCG21_10695 [Pseudactinotalea sp. HY160]|uniref:hypothetical protein n=1 Tax=Pseudactinotalea sp. HY160 TaxID=2654490 RepID=UPI00128C50CC|nr:hypothetical protein [Pseudactinotalea sp. HY160]MPV50462.1 hypothetical protein [Pseudactinotalea sp. HY160]
MGAQRPRTVVLDAGALIAIDRGERRLLRLLELAGAVHFPAGALAQAWRNPARQVRLARLVGAAEVTIHPFDETVAKAAGALCAATATADVIDASVVLLSRAVEGVLVTSDPVDMRRLDPAIDLALC